MSHIISLDVETSGPDVIENMVLAIGGAIVAVDTGNVVRTFLAIDLLVMHAEVNGILSAGWDAKTYREFWTNPKKGKDNVTTPLTLLQAVARQQPELFSDYEMGRSLAVWLKEAFAEFPSAVIVVDTVSFDTTFLNNLLSMHSDIPNLLYASGKYRTVRDLYSWAYGLAGRSFGQAKDGAVTLACQRYGIAPPDEALHDHNPVNDATYIALSAAALCRAIEGSSCSKP